MDLYSQIGVLFLIMLVGLYSRKKNILNDELNKGLSTFLMNITLPLLIINSFDFQYSQEMLNNILKALIYSFLAFIITIIVGNIMFHKIEDGKKQVLKFAIVFSNCGFMGFPIIEGVFGKEGIVYASIFNMIFTIFLWTYGVMLFSGEKSVKDWKKILRNPGIIAVVIGLIIMILSIDIPIVIKTVTEMVGGMTTPLSMIITGSMMAQVSLKSGIRDINMYYGVTLRLLVIPLILFIITIPFNISSVPLSTVIISEAMPIAATTSIFAQTFNKEKEFSAFSVFMSTLLSIVTIPLILKIIS